MECKHFQFEGHRIAYHTYGEGKRAVVLVHGLLFDQKMHEPLAQKLAENGNFVITIDMVGHGQSDAPIDRFDMTRYSHAVNRLLTKLHIKEAVIGGTSLGANIGLEFAVHHPEKLRGLICDMPALERSLVGGAAVFTPILIGAEYAEPIVRVASRLMRLIPSKPFPYSVNLALDLMKRDPKVTGHVLKGIYFGRIAPPRRERMDITAPTFVIGHKFDPVHQFGDALELAGDLENGVFTEARSVLELRLMPKRLTKEIVHFVDECWKLRAVDSKRSGRSGRPAAVAAAGDSGAAQAQAARAARPLMRPAPRPARKSS